MIAKVIILAALATVCLCADYEQSCKEKMGPDAVKQGSDYVISFGPEGGCKEQRCYTGHGGMGFYQCRPAYEYMPSTCEVVRAGLKDCYINVSGEDKPYPACCPTKKETICRGDADFDESKLPVLSWYGERTIAACRE